MFRTRCRGAPWRSSERAPWMPDQQHIAWFDRHDPATEPVLGGKNTSLGILTMAGLPVPPGFAITAAAYREAFRDSGIDGTLAAMMADLDPEDAVVLTRVAAEARGTIVDAGLPRLAHRPGRRGVRRPVRAHGPGRGPGGGPVLRDVRGPARRAASPASTTRTCGCGLLAEVQAHVLRCWASLYTDRAIAYRRQMAYAEDTARHERRHPADGAAAGERGGVHAQPAQRRPLPDRHRRLVGPRRGRRQSGASRRTTTWSTR